MTLVLMVVVVIFSLANAAAVPFHYFPGKETPVSLALIIIIAALAGAIAGVVTSLSSQIKLRQKITEQEQQLRDLQREKTDLTGDVRAQRLNQRRPNRTPED